MRRFFMFVSQDITVLISMMEFYRRRSWLEDGSLDSFAKSVCSYLYFRPKKMWILFAKVRTCFICSFEIADRYSNYENMITSVHVFLSPFPFFIAIVHVIEIFWEVIPSSSILHVCNSFVNYCHHTHSPFEWARIYIHFLHELCADHFRKWSTKYGCHMLYLYWTQHSRYVGIFLWINAKNHVLKNPSLRLGTPKAADATIELINSEMLVYFDNIGLLQQLIEMLISSLCGVKNARPELKRKTQYWHVLHIFTISSFDFVSISNTRVWMKICGFVKTLYMCIFCEDTHVIY